MNKLEFKAALREKLSGLSPAEVDERISFYMEMIADRMEEGLTEEEAVAACGTPDEIAAQSLSETSILKLVADKIKPKRKLQTWEIVLIILGFPLWFSLLATIFATAISLYVSLWSVVVALWASVGTLWATGFASLVSGIVLCFVGKAPAGLLLISCALVCAGVGIFLFYAGKLATKYTWKLAKYLVLIFKKLLTRKEETQ